MVPASEPPNETKQSVVMTAMKTGPARRYGRNLPRRVFVRSAIMPMRMSLTASHRLAETMMIVTVSEGIFSRSVKKNMTYIETKL